MSTTTITHKVNLPAQQLWSAAKVKVELCTPSFDSAAATISGVATLHVSRDGSCPLQLTPNSELNPAGTWYIVTDPDGTQWAVVVPVSAGAVSLQACLVNNPAAPGQVISGLAPTAVKTADYTASANDLVPVDTTSGGVLITLPTAPPDKTQVGVKHIVRGGTNVVTIARAGTDVLNKAGGSTTLTLTLLNQSAVLQYKASVGIWYVIATDLPLAQLDAVYAARNSGNAADPNLGAIPVSSDGMAGYLNWFVQDSSPFAFHGTTGPGFTGTGVIGVSPDNGGVGLFADNKGAVASTAAVKIVNTIAGTTFTTAYGLWGQQASTKGPLVFLESVFGGSADLLRLKGTSWGAGQVLASIRRSDDSVAWSVDAQHGRHTFFDIATVKGEDFAAAKIIVDASKRNAAEVELRLYRDGGNGVLCYPYRISTKGVGAGDVLTFYGGNASNTSDGSETVFPVVSISGAGGAKLGFFGTAPVAKPTITGSRGANAALASLLTSLAAFGLITDSSTA